MSKLVPNLIGYETSTCLVPDEVWNILMFPCIWIYLWRVLPRGWLVSRFLYR